MKMASEKKVTLKSDTDKFKMFNPHNMMGWNRWAFTLAFYFLAQKDISDEDLFDYSMMETLRLGGHSDTNCCIVGGLIGAAVGLEKIDNEKVQKILTCDTEDGNHPRPDFINPGKAGVEEMID